MRILALILFPLTLLATEFAPWYETSLELYPYVSYGVQQYDTVQTKFGSVPRATLDHFARTGIYSFYDIYAIELETLFDETRKNPFGFDFLKLTGRYRYMDDIAGDLLSVVFGASYIQTVSERRDDISLFHHGNVEGELFVSFGQECPCGIFFISRWWALFCVGLADKGCPWLRSQLQYDYNLRDVHRFGIFLRALVGLGNEDLDLSEPFHGYGDIAHRSFEVGASYRFHEACYGMFTFEYRYRLLSRNFPEQTSFFELIYTFPFGI